LLTVHVLAFSGAENPSRVLDANDDREVRKRFQRIIDSGRRPDLRLGLRGGFALRWTEGRDFHVIIRGGVVGVASDSGAIDTYADTADLESFLRVLMSAELAELDRPAATSDLYPPFPTRA
jgi:hypothetical protein